MKFFILVITLLGTISSYASKGRGGGHSTTGVDGEEITLDLFEDYSVQNDVKKEIDPRNHPVFRAAYGQVDVILSEIGNKYPDFVELINHFNNKIIWELSNLPLEMINDSDVTGYTSKLNQACYNSNGKYIFCDKMILDKMNVLNKTALVLHEVLLQGLGLHFNRDSLRRIVSSFVLNKNAKFEVLKEELDSVSPYILQGKLEFKVATSSNDSFLSVRLHEQKENSSHIKISGESVSCDLPRNSLERSDIKASFSDIKCSAVILTIDNLRGTGSDVVSLIESWNEDRVYYFINNSFRYSETKNNSTIGFKERSIFFSEYVLSNYLDKL